MAKTQIKRLKAERFWRWTVVNVFGNQKAAAYYAKHPIKQRKPRFRWRKKLVRELEQSCDRAWERVQAMLEERRNQAPATPAERSK